MLKTRIITALVLIACFIPALFKLPITYWAIVMLAVSLLALYEWASMIKLTSLETKMYLGLVLLLGLSIVPIIERQGFHFLFYNALIIFIITAIFWIIVVPFWLAKKWFFQQKLFMSIIGLILMFPLWLALICSKGANPWLLLCLLGTIWIADSAAYFAGKNFGKHKLAPTISPGKTWEGVLGALIAVTLFGAILFIGFKVDTLAMFPALWIITGLGVIGDLFESMIKRQANIKDSGDLLPGHGGILDRIDGVIPSLPVAILMIYAYNYVKVFN
jgi:phosphatidate cytidylyltransferase